MKRCRKCEEFKEKSAFKKNKRAKDGLDSWCYDCSYGLRKLNHEKYRKTERARELKKYGITLEDYENMRVLQDHKCAICSTGEENSRHQKFCIDHDHVSGKVRQLLCDKCNVGLGSFKDNQAFLLKAVAYLEKHRSRG